MVKLIGMLKRPDHVAVEEFHRWWLEQHAPLAKKLPGLRRYVISLAKAGFFGEPTYDGVAELWFDDEEALKKAFASPEWEAARKDVEAHVKEIVRIVTEEHSILP